MLSPSKDTLSGFETIEGLPRIIALQHRVHVGASEEMILGRR